MFVGNLLIAVIGNNGNSDAQLAIDTRGGEVKSWRPYLTGPDEGEELKPLSPLIDSNSIVIPKKSVVTLVGSLR